MSLTLFGTSRSRAFRALWMLEETGLPYEHRPLSPQQCAGDAAYRAINPAGTILCLLDDDFVLGESLAINLWLAAKGPVALRPVGARGHALALQWSLWAATALEPAYVRWAEHTCWLPDAQRSPAEAASALAELERPLRRLDDALDGRHALLGGDFSVADLNVAGVIPLLRHAPLDGFKRAKDWLARCCARAAFARAGALA